MRGPVPMKWPMAMLTAGVLLLVQASPLESEPNNPVALFILANSSDIRGYRCQNWRFMDYNARVGFILGAIAMQDTIQAIWEQSGAVYTGGLDALIAMASSDLPRSAADYTRLLDAACLISPPTMPVLALLYWVK